MPSFDPGECILGAGWPTDREVSSPGYSQSEMEARIIHRVKTRLGQNLLYLNLFPKPNTHSRPYGAPVGLHPCQPHLQPVSITSQIIAEK